MPPICDSQQCNEQGNFTFSRQHEQQKWDGCAYLSQSCTSTNCPMPTEMHINVFRHTCWLPWADVWITALTVCAVIPPCLTPQSRCLFSAQVSKRRAKAKTQKHDYLTSIFIWIVLVHVHLFYIIDSNTPEFYEMWMEPGMTHRLVFVWSQ